MILDRPPHHLCPRNLLQRRAAGLLLPMAVALILSGCATLPWRDAGRPLPEDGPEPSPAVLVETWLDSMAAVLPPQERMDWLAANPEVQELEELYRQAVHFTAQRFFGPAEDLLFVLKEKVASPPAAGADSLNLAYRRSLERRVVLLAGLLSEERLILGGEAPNDSLLMTYYDGLKGLSLPDSLATITVEERRAIEHHLLDVQHPLVDEWISYFCGPGRGRFASWLERKAELDSLLTARLTTAGLPAELIHLAIIESGLSPTALSNVGALGYWQFMPGTARHFQLRKDYWVDDRRDVERSTTAAATYLSQLYKQFGDWALVLAAYNAGEGRVERAIQRAGHRDFWRLPLPNQTVNHIPKFIAAHRVCSDPEGYGFSKPRPAPLRFEELPVDTPTDLDVLARCAGVTREQLRALNPALLHGVTPPDRSGYTLRVPPGRASRTVAELARIPADKRLAWLHHSVRRGETLSGIAARYGTTVARICEANKIRKDRPIHPNQQLVIPMTGQAGAAATMQVARAGGGGRAAGPARGERVDYRVRRGDTLHGIARRLGVSVRHLCQTNGIAPSATIHPGQRLHAYPNGR